MTETVIVRSADNERYRKLLSLSTSSRERRKLRRTVIEGEKLLSAFLDTIGVVSPTVHDVFVNQSMLDQSVLNRLESTADVKPIVLADGLFKSASQLATPAGPIAIVDTPSRQLPDRFDEDLVYLDRVQDPGNVGTILRTCAAAGVRDVVTSAGTAFCWAPKVLRSAMGGHFALRVYEGIEPPELFEHLSSELTRRAIVAPDSVNDSLPIGSLHESDLSEPCAWFFGSEGTGLRSEMIQTQTTQLTIDQAPSVESLNVASAVAICLFEARRQRR